MPLKGVLEKRGYLRSLWKVRKGMGAVTDSYSTNYNAKELPGGVYDLCAASLLLTVCYLPVEADFSLCANSFM